MVFVDPVAGVCGAAVEVPAGFAFEDTRIVFVCPAAGAVPGTTEVGAAGLAATEVEAFAGALAGLAGTDFPFTAASIRFDTFSTESRTEFSLSTLSLISSYHFFFAAGATAAGVDAGVVEVALGMAVVEVGTVDGLAVGFVAARVGFATGFAEDGWVGFAAGVEAFTIGLGATVAGWTPDGVGFEVETGAFTRGLVIPAG
jgi:hypothetical protein